MRYLILVHRQPVQSGCLPTLSKLSQGCLHHKLGDVWPGLRPLQLSSQRSRQTQLSCALQLPLFEASDLAAVGYRGVTPQSRQTELPVLWPALLLPSQDTLNDSPLDATWDAGL